MKNIAYVAFGCLIAFCLVGCALLKGSCYQCVYKIEDAKHRPECVLVIQDVSKKFGFKFGQSGLYARSESDPPPIGYEGSNGSRGATLVIAYRRVGGDAIVITQEYNNNKTEFISLLEAEIEAKLDKILGKNGYRKQEETHSKPLGS